MTLSLLWLFFLTSLINSLDPKKLVKLSQKLDEQLESRKGEGKTLISGLRTYRDYLKEVLRLVENNTTEGNKLYAALEKTLGPLHVQTPIYNVLMTRAFNISFGDVEEIEEIIAQTKDLWNEIRIIETNKTIDIL